MKITGTIRLWKQNVFEMQCLKHIPVNKKELDIVRNKNPLSRRQFFVTNEVGCKECQAEKESYRKMAKGL